MADDWCEREQLPRSMCGHCRASRSVVTAVQPDFEALADMAEEGESAEVGATIEARYYGKCRGCGERWSPGDMITYSLGEDGWVCVQCAGT